MTFAMVGSAAGAVGTAVGGVKGASNLMGMFGDAGKASGAAYEAKQKRKEARQKREDYLGMIKRASAMGAEGEEQFLGEYNQAPPELAGAREALLSGQSDTMQQASGEIGKNLAVGGVRGGQATTLQNRAVGGIANQGVQDIDMMQYEDALKRRSAKGGFFGQKGATGQSRSLTAPSY